MPEKTHKTAVVLVPPESVWGPIQAIRRAHDRQVRRWMPHVTLLYPFRPREAFDSAAPALEAAAAGVEPFEVTLDEFRWFRHGRGRSTMWLAPEPADRLVGLQAVLQAAVPDCDDVARHRKGFVPHLSVGQAPGRAALEETVAALRAEWRPVRFRAEEVSLIYRGDPPEDVFRVARTCRLGGPDIS